MTTRERIVEAANRKPAYGDAPGGFVNTDGDWCATRTPEEFKAFLENNFGFEVTDCRSTAGSAAVATTACGLRIAWNGYCRKL